MSSATEIVAELEKAVQRVLETSNKLQEKQNEITELSKQNQSAVQVVNDLRADLDKALNEQLGSVGMETSSRTRISR